MKGKLFTLCFVLFLAASCSNDDDNPAAVDPDAPVAARITATVGGTWNADSIGVIALPIPDHDMYARYHNAHYVTTSTGTTAEFAPANADHTIYFSGPDEDIYFCAYAPYQPSATPDALPGTNGYISVDTRRQSTAKAQEAIDFITARGAIASKSKPTVSFKDHYSFRHGMNRLVLKIETPASAGFHADDVERISSVKIGGLCTRGFVEIDCGGGTFHFGSEGGSRTKDWDITETVNSVETEDGVKRRIYTLIFPPNQGVKDEAGDPMGAIPLSITLDKQEYRNTTDLKGESKVPGYFRQGTSYEYTIRLKNKDLEVTDVAINDR